MSKERMEDYLNVGDTEYLYYRTLAPEGTPIADILIVHGFAEHSGRYGELIKSLVESGFRVLIFDLRGHGRSSGRRGDIESFELYLNDIMKMRKILGNGSERPLFLLGHSLGGLLVILSAQRDQEGLAGVVSCSPFLRLAFKPPSIKVMMAKMVVKLLPHLQMSNEIDPSLLSHDKTRVREYEEDPLVHHLVTPRWFLNSLEYQKRAFDDVEKIHIPIFLIHGSGDGITSHAATEEFYEKLKSNDRSIRLFDGLYHELFQETSRSEVIKTVLEWLKEHT